MYALYKLVLIRSSVDFRGPEFPFLFPRPPENFIVIEIRTWAASVIGTPFRPIFTTFVFIHLKHFVPPFCLLWLINMSVHKKYTISTVSLSHFLSSSFYSFFLFFSSIHLKFSFYCRVIKIIHPKYKSHFNVILANQTICFFLRLFCSCLKYNIQNYCVFR